MNWKTVGMTQGGLTEWQINCYNNWVTVGRKKWVTEKLTKELTEKYLKQSKL